MRGHGRRTPAPAHSPPLRYSGGGLNVAARHILLALYPRHRDLHFRDHAAGPAPEGLAETAEKEVAEYLPITCRRFNTPVGRQKGTPYPLSALLYPAQPPYPTRLRPPENWVSFLRRPACRPQRNLCRTDGPRVQAPPTSGASRHASERRIAGTPAPRQPRRYRGDHPPLTPTRPRRLRSARGPASAPANKAPPPGRDQGPATMHHPIPRAPRHTNSTTLTSAHHRHPTAAP